MGRNVVLTASPIGNLAVKRNSRTSKYKGVTTSGKGKRQARAWCTRRRKFIALGTFPNSPEAAVAVATAEAQGIESLPTPEPRKRTGRRDCVLRAPPPKHSVFLTLLFGCLRCVCSS